MFVSTSLLLLGIVSLSASPVSAATVTVTTTSDTTAVDGAVSLREAISSVNAGANVNADVVATGVYGTNDIIAFNIPGGGVKTIDVAAGGLPTLTAPVTIDGYSQPGASANTNPLAGGSNAVMLIELNGASAGADGLTVLAANSTVRGLVINWFMTGIVVNGVGASGAKIEGNFIGTDAAGGAAQANQRGVVVSDAPNVTVGGSLPAARNVISGSAGSYGVIVERALATGVKIQGNYVGTNAAGTTSVTNAGGILVNDAPAVLIGGSADGAGNVVSGNFTHAIDVFGSIASGTTIQGNLIGTTANGSARIAGTSNVYGITVSAPNVTIGGTVAGARNVIVGHFVGITQSGGDATGLVIQGNYIGTNLAGTEAIGNVYGIQVGSQTQIGGTTASARNVIAGNISTGIKVGGSEQGVTIQGNYVGVGADGTKPLGNGVLGLEISNVNNVVIGGADTNAANIIANHTDAGVRILSGSGVSVRGNSIYNNGKTTLLPVLGIDLGSDGVTANDVGDGDSGPNNRQNYPLLTAATTSSSQTHASGTLNSTPGSTLILDFYASPDCHVSGYGEGKTYLGAKTVNTDGSGNATFNVTGLSPIASGSIVTATATDAGGNTSEFSACRTAAAAALTVTNSSMSIDAGGPGSNFAVSLASVPASTVTVNFAFDSTRLSVSPASLTFQANGTATTPQAVTVRALAGAASGGAQGAVSSPSSLPIAITSTSSDAAYHGLTAAPVVVTVAAAGSPSCGPSISSPSVKTAAVNGALEVTITSANVHASNRNLTQLQFGAMQNAQVAYNGQAVSNGQTVTLPANATQAVFTVRRATPGQATTVPLVVIDGCGSLTTFVGGGPNAGF